MGFWIFMLIMVLLIPIIMVFFGRIFLKKAPKEINYVFGYRTSRSMKNKDTWEFAHKYIGDIWHKCGIIMIPISVIVMLLVIGKDEDTVGTVGAIVTIIQMIPLIGAIYPTEKALKKYFDKNGERKYFLRPVTKQDAKLLFDWTNDPVTRQNSFSTKPVLWEEHLNWLNQKVNDANCLFFIMCDGKHDFGTIRIEYKDENNRIMDEKGKQAIISFSIAPEYRGKGLGVKMLALGEQKAKTWKVSGKQIDILIGEVKEENIASRKCFEKNDYILDKEMNGELVFVKRI